MPFYNDFVKNQTMVLFPAKTGNFIGTVHESLLHRRTTCLTFFLPSDS